MNIFVFIYKLNNFFFLIFIEGFTPAPVKPNQPVTMDFRQDRVRLVTDPSGRVVAQVPTVG